MKSIWRRWLWLLYLFRRWGNCSKHGSRALKIQQKFHVLFVGRIVAGEIPVFWLISLTEKSFSSAKNVMYACSSALKARVKTLHGKWNSQTFTIGYLNQERHTSWFSWHQLLCCYLFSINYLLFREMYEIYREQIYVPALNAQNRLFQSNTYIYTCIYMYIHVYMYIRWFASFSKNINMHKTETYQ